MNKAIFIKSVFTGVLCNSFKIVYAYLNDEDKVRECYSCLKMMIKTHLHVGFIPRFLTKRAPLKQFYLYMKLSQSSTMFKQKNNHEVYCDWNFCIFATPNSKTIIATLRIVTIEKSELTCLLTLYFHGNSKWIFYFSTSVNNLKVKKQKFSLRVNNSKWNLMFYEVELVTRKKNF